MTKHKAKLLTCSGLVVMLLAGCGTVPALVHASPQHEKAFFWQKEQLVEFTAPAYLSQFELMEQADSLLTAGNYSAIEKQAVLLRRSKAEFLDGRSQLSAFYNGLSWHTGEDTEAAWSKKNRQLLKWRKKHPRSITAQIALVGNYNAGDWIAYYAGGEKAKKYQKNRTRRRKALDVLYAPKSSARSCPGWYFMAQLLAENYAPAKDIFEQATNEGLARHGYIKELHFSKIQNLSLPHIGKPGQWQQYAARIADQKKAWLATDFIPRRCGFSSV